MGLNLEQKKALVSDVGERISEAGAVVLAEYRGVEVEGMTALREKAREKGVFIRVLKNTLARRAFSGTSYEALIGHMKGPLAYAMSPDPVALAKVLVDFASENDKLVIKVGGMPNSVMLPQQVKQLATMPSREELLAKLMGTCQAPIAKLMRGLSGVPEGFVRTLVALRDQKEKTS